MNYIDELNEAFAKGDPEYRIQGAVVDIVTALAQRRIALGLSQAQVAAKMGAKQPRVAQIEALDRKTSLETIVRYAAALGAELRVCPGH